MSGDTTVLLKGPAPFTTVSEPTARPTYSLRETRSPFGMRVVCARCWDEQYVMRRRAGLPLKSSLAQSCARNRRRPSGETGKREPGFLLPSSPLSEAGVAHARLTGTRAHNGGARKNGIDRGPQRASSPGRGKTPAAKPGLTASSSAIDPPDPRLSSLAGVLRTKVPLLLRRVRGGETYVPKRGG
ncbi:hypothetical protein MRX96_009543 [Rhipicephalus microplus]